VHSPIPQSPDSSYVFHSGQRPLKRFGWVRTDYLAAASAAGLPKHKRLFHTIRHTVATQLPFLGTDIAVLKQQLGHKSLRMTLRYAHVAPGELKEAAERLGEKVLGNFEMPAPLITFKSQSPVLPTEPKLVATQNAPLLRSVPMVWRRWQDHTHQTVNPWENCQNDGDQVSHRRPASGGRKLELAEFADVSHNLVTLEEPDW
jgi:Phage integrase family